MSPLTVLRSVRDINPFPLSSNNILCRAFFLLLTAVLSPFVVSSSSNLASPHAHMERMCFYPVSLRCEL
jgi:hypothetical protein